MDSHLSHTADHLVMVGGSERMKANTGQTETPKFHSADIEPAGDHVSHILMINGLPVARFNDLQKALDARQLAIEQAIEQYVTSS